MSTRLVLVGIVLLLCSSVGYATSHDTPITVIETTTNTNVQISGSSSQQVVSQVDPANLLVDIEILEPSGGFKAQSTTQKFWVNIYVTPATYKSLGSTTIKLTSTDPAVAAFTGSGQNGEIFSKTPSYSNGAFSVTIPENGLTGNEFETVMPEGKYFLGKLQMEVKKDGNFNVNLASGSSAVGTSQPYVATFGYSGKLSNYVTYKVAQKSSKIIEASPACVPKTAAQCPTTNCGTINDACGGKVVCTNNCVSGQVCVNNACVNALDKVLPNPSVQEKDVLVAVANAFQGKDKNGNALAQCPGTFCTLTKLNVIVNAIKAWLASA